MSVIVANRFVEQQGSYLLSHSVGLPLKATQSLVEQAFWQPWLQADGGIWQHWLAQIERFRQQLGLLLNSDPKNFCPQTNISSAVTKIIYSLEPPSKKNIILMSEEDFPSVGFALQQSQSLGYRIRYIPADLNLNDMQVWDDYLSDNVALVLVTQVQSNNGTQLPIKAITSMASERSVTSLIDIAQAVGIIPIDIQQWSADFIVGSCLKWLSGGPGAGFMWVNPEILEHCRPHDVGWFSHQNPFEFDIHHFSYAKDALRFWGGTPSIHPFIVACAGLKFSYEIGIDNIREYNLAMTERIIQSLDSGDLVSPIMTDQRSGTLIIHFGERHNHMVQLLRKNNIHFDSRAKGIRLSPHLYNSEAQIEALAILIRNNR